MRLSTSLTTLLIATLSFAIAGCETTDKILTAAEQVAKGRTGQTILDLAFRANPNRFVNKAPAPPQKPTAVWINPPAQKLKLQA